MRGSRLDYCYVLEEGECCFDEECSQVLISNETCLVPVCIQGICVEIPDNDRCDKDTCCCEDKGICSAECCPPECKSDKECPKDECCCKDGTCSSDCCASLLRDRQGLRRRNLLLRGGTCSQRMLPGTANHDRRGTVGQLPNTGAGPDEDAASWIAGAALAAGAAALLGSKLRPETTPAEEPES